MNLTKVGWPWFRNRKKDAPKIKTVNVVFGFFLTANFCIATGFLGVPYSFFYAGILTATPTFLFLAVINWINANYLLEVMARGQVNYLPANIPMMFTWWVAN